MLPESLQERVESFDSKDAADSDLKSQHSYIKYAQRSDFLTLQDMNLNYTFAGNAFRDYFNIDEKDIIGKTDSDIFNKQQAKLNTYESKQILDTGLP